MIKILLLSLLSAHALAEATESPQDFAEGIPIAVNAQQAYEVVITQAIYQRIQTADLHDLRIFDAAGNSVAYAILPAPPIVANTAEQQKPLTLFPITRSSNPTADDFNLRVQRDARGQILQINTANTPPTASTPDYLLDLGDAEQPKPQQLQISWNHPLVSQAQLTLYSSDDLLHWQSIGSGALLLVQQGDQSILANVIRINTHQRYLKISSETAELQLQQVMGIYQSREAAADERQWYTASFIQFEKPENRYHFTLPIALPVEAARVIPADNTVLKIARIDQDRLQHSYLTAAEWYRFSIQNQVIETPALKMPVTQAANWYLHLPLNASPPAQPPQFLVAWRPARLRFLSNTAGEYLIAYGSKRIDTPAPALPSALQKSDLKTITLTLSQPITLSGDAALKPPTNYRSIILWATLISALLLLAGIARSLLSSPSKS
jgi:hypothetical protein